MTFDPYTNLVPFGLLTEEEQAALKAHPGPWECYGVNAKWKHRTRPDWVEFVVYRAVRPAPEPLWIAPEVWRVLDPCIRGAQSGERGQVWVFDALPGDRLHRIDNLFAPHLIRRGTDPWDQSLIQRPEDV
jgi:hypothetical protein